MCYMCGGRVGFFGGNIRKIMDDLQELKWDPIVVEPDKNFSFKQKKNDFKFFSFKFPCRPTLFISVPRVLNRVYDKVSSMFSACHHSLGILGAQINFENPFLNI